MTYTRTILDSDDTLATSILTALAANHSVVEKSVTVLDQDDPELLDKADVALNSTGLLLLVEGNELREDAEGVLEATIRVRVEELVAQNRSTAGTGIAAHRWAKEIWTSLVGAFPSNEWSDLSEPSIVPLESGEDVQAWLITAVTRAGSGIADHT